MKTVKSIITEVIDEFVHATIGENKWIPIYRVGEIEKSEFGYFFAFDLDYYDYTDTSYKRKDAKRYLLNMNAKIWDPVKELNLDVISWSRIDGLTKDFEKYGISDETDWEMDEKYSSTSTDGLASAAKRLGYQAVIIRSVPQCRRPWYNDDDSGFDEICIFDTSIIKKG